MTAILCPTWFTLSLGDTQLHRNILNKRLWCKPHSQFGRQTNTRSIGLDSRPARHGALKMARCSGENLWTGQQSVRVQRSILPSGEGARWHPKANGSLPGCGWKQAPLSQAPMPAPSSCHSPPCLCVILLFTTKAKSRGEG